jgi:hypothetical protein
MAPRHRSAATPGYVAAAAECCKRLSPPLNDSGQEVRPGHFCRHPPRATSNLQRVFDLLDLHRREKRPVDLAGVAHDRKAQVLNVTARYSLHVGWSHRAHALEECSGALPATAEQLVGSEA